MNTRKPLLVSVFIGLMLVSGCYWSREVTKRSELKNPDLGTIKIYSKDSVLYELESYRLQDSIILGQGQQTTRAGRLPFEGSIHLNEIVYISAKEFDFWKAVIAVGGIGFIGAGGASATADDGLTIHRVSNSCPTIYSWDSHRFVYEGESFSTAIGKALECESTTLLPSIVPDDALLRLRICNERPETHYINSVRLVAFAADPNASMIMDIENRAWPVFAPTGPVTAVDHSGRICTQELSLPDKNSWTSDCATAKPGRSYQDTICLSFAAPEKMHRAATLVVSGSNTALPITAIHKSLEFLGDESFMFLQSIENDDGDVELIKKWVDESSLKVEVRTGGQWRHSGTILPEATGLRFTRGVRLKLDVPENEEVKVRFTCLSDTWTLDAVRIDWYDGTACDENPVSCISVINSEGKDVRTRLAAADKSYEILFPGDKIEILCNESQTHHGQKTWYAVKARGYLYEWFPEPKAETQSVSFLSHLPPPRLPILKALLGQRELLLYSLYSYWRQVR